MAASDNLFNDFAYVIINIADVNDNDPKFEKHTYKGKVPEDAKGRLDPSKKCLSATMVFYRVH